MNKINALVDEMVESPDFQSGSQWELRVRTPSSVPKLKEKATPLKAN